MRTLTENWRAVLSKYFDFVSVCVFVCLFTMNSSIFGKSSHFPFPYFVLFWLYLHFLHLNRNILKFVSLQMYLAIYICFVQLCVNDTLCILYIIVYIIRRDYHILQACTLFWYGNLLMTYSMKYELLSVMQCLSL